jgi:hypothetical protein
MTVTALYAGRTPPYHSLDTGNAGFLFPYNNNPSPRIVTANLAYYVPVSVRVRVVVRRLWVACGSTGTGTYDLGIYDPDGTRLVSTGSVSKVATTTEIVTDVTDTTVGPGIVYVAFVGASGTDTWSFWDISAPSLAATGVLVEVLGSAVLPATATWVMSSALTVYPLAGMELEGTVSL